MMLGRYSTFHNKDKRSWKRFNLQIQFHKPIYWCWGKIKVAKGKQGREGWEMGSAENILSTTDKWGVNEAFSSSSGWWCPSSAVPALLGSGTMRCSPPTLARHSPCLVRTCLWAAQSVLFPRSRTATPSSAASWVSKKGRSGQLQNLPWIPGAHPVYTWNTLTDTHGFGLITKLEILK